jgi:hypothetical protein
MFIYLFNVLIAALIGDIDKLDGEVKISGTVAYCPQVAWIKF